jgi:hypothetical protein
MTKLDRTRPYGTVCGMDKSLGYLYEQDGIRFNHNGDPVGQPPDALEERLKLDAEGVMPGTALETTLPKTALEVDGETVVIDIDSNGYTTKKEISAMIEKLGGTFNPQDTRPQLIQKLTDLIRVHT